MVRQCNEAKEIYYRLESNANMAHFCSRYCPYELIAVLLHQNLKMILWKPLNLTRQ